MWRRANKDLYGNVKSPFKITKKPILPEKEIEKNNEREVQTE